MNHKGLLAGAVVVVLTGLSAAPATAQYFGRNKVQYDSFDFRTFNTERFEVYYYEEEEQAVRDAARMAERWYRRHSRTYLRDFKRKKPLIFYANDADFQQTNVIRGSIGQGTGGVTESLKERVIMPMTGLYADTDHVLGHELVHSFQYDIALSREDTSRFGLSLIPLWLVEGTAEYLSVGRTDPHTAMWMRDAAVRDDLPTMEQLSKDFKYFPYRYGQAYMAYVGGKYGDAAVANIFKMAGRAGLDSALVYTLGISSDSLSSEWAAAIKEAYLPLVEGRTPVDSVGRTLVNKKLDGGDINISPVVSPDGKWVAFLSERDLFHINLFIADAETGKVVKKLKGMASDPHFDAIRFINSAGSWSPDGRNFAFVTFVEGDNEIAVLDWRTGDIDRRIAVKGVTALANPAWSPDGKSIAFTGLNGGISDLYIFDIRTSAVRQITNDRFGDLHPAWSPDGKTIVLSSDRGENGTNFETLDYAKVRLSFVDVATGDIDTIIPLEGGQHTNPQFSPDGRDVYFLSDYDGFKDAYRYNLDDKSVYRITKLQTGISSFTSLSPAMSVAAQSGRMVFSVFSENTYSIHSLEPDELQGELVEFGDEPELAGVLPPANALDAGLVSSYLNDPLSGLPDPADYSTKAYGPRLKLDYVAPPSVGVTAGGPFGTGVSGGIGLFFSDMLGDHNLTIVAQANGTFKDIGGQVAYLNQKRRLNYGGSIAHIPYLIGYTQAGFDQSGNLVYEQIRQRIFVDQVDLLGSYPFSTTRRVDITGGFTRYGFSIEVDRFTSSNGVTFVREREKLDARDPIYFFQTGAALVGDHSFFGFTSPVNGGRYRLQVNPLIGSESFVRVLGDYRRYFFQKPVTLAVRGLHIGNYFARSDNEDAIFSQEYLGYSNSLSYVRGYSFSSLEPNENIEGLLGNRIATASAEIRVPLFGTEDFGLIRFPYLPTEVAFFADAGLAWTEQDAPVLAFKNEAIANHPIASAGISTRFNLFGYTVLEIFYAHPFQRPDKGSHFGFQIVPGW